MSISIFRPTTVGSAPRRGAARPASLSDLLVRAFDVYFAWCHRSASRRALRSLDDRLLRDVGLNRLEAEEEGRKPFWL